MHKTPLLPALSLAGLFACPSWSLEEGDWVVETVCELPGGTGGVEVDQQGNVYVADFSSKLGTGGTGGHRLYRIDPKGQVELIVTSLRGGSGNAIGPDGAFYQSNIGGNSISRISLAKKPNVETFLTRGLRSPVGIAIDDDGFLFVANCGAGSIALVSPAAEVEVFCQSPLLSCPNGIALDLDHNLYVANFNNGDVIKIDWEGKASRLATLPGNNNGHLIYHKDALYVVARGAHQIYKVSLTGKIELFAGTGKRGSADGPTNEASFSYPNDIGVTADGKSFYVNHNASVTAPHTELAPMLVRRIRLIGPSKNKSEKELQPEKQAPPKQEQAKNQQGLCFGDVEN